MQEIVEAFVNETRVMNDAYKEHTLRLQKQRQTAYDSLSSVDFVCSNWQDNDDLQSLQKVREHIASCIESLGDDKRAVDSIQSELNDRKKSVKDCLSVLLELYRELTISTPPLEGTNLEDQVADVLFHARPDFMYYVGPETTDANNEETVEHREQPPHSSVS